MAALAGLAGPAPAADQPLTFSGKVEKVIDGDSIMVRKGRKLLKVRLHQVDCPELSQPYGKQARNLTRKLTLGRVVRVEDAVVDKYYRSRLRGSVILPDGRDLGMELVKNGLAWDYRRYSENPLITDLEKEARRAKLGLWAAPKQRPPWEWRKEHYSRIP